METHWGDGKDTTDTSRVWHDGDIVAGPEEEFFDEESVDTVGDEDNEDVATEKETPTEKPVADDGSETPSPPEELRENTNVETEELKEAIKEAPEDAPNGPQTENLDNVPKEVEK